MVRDGAVFAILDPPEGASATGIVSYVQSTAALLGLTEHAAIYWPRVKVLNPAKSVFGPADKIVVPPSGIIAGVFARTDSARPGGVYDPPAGIDKGRMFGVLGFETDEVLEEAKRDLVYPKRINPITTGPGLPRYIDGSRTLKGGGNFPYVAERRGVIFIERSLKQGLQFARHKNNTEGLRAQVRRTITVFLLTQMNRSGRSTASCTKSTEVDERPQAAQSTTAPSEARSPTSSTSRAARSSRLELYGAKRSTVRATSASARSQQEPGAAHLLRRDAGAWRHPGPGPLRLVDCDLRSRRSHCTSSSAAGRSAVRVQDVAITSSGLGLTGVNYKRNLDIVQQDRDGTTLRRWSLSRAWPVKLTSAFGLVALTALRPALLDFVQFESSPATGTTRPTRTSSSP